ncbi:MAG: transcription initiation factor IIB [Desulfurococcales archaeon]|jgi:transcription initiation factor TFIIB|nr:transcription initiation factor IIB [Desulfurococcales archaeon]MCC6062746.1 transcription initiation factor IIB [Desulfurococcales archaeon]
MSYSATSSTEAKSIKGESSIPCPSGRIIYDEARGEKICLDTGEVIEERLIDTGPDWRAYTSEEREKRARAGSPISPILQGSDVTSIIDIGGKDATGKKLDLKKKIEYARMRKLQLRTKVQNTLDRNIAQAYAELSKLGNALGLSKEVIDQAAIIYKKAIESGLIRGRAIESIVAAALYAACRVMGTPRSLDEIVKYTRSDRKEIARCYRLLWKELNWEELNIEIPKPDPSMYIPRIVAQLGLSGNVEAIAKDIVAKIRNTGIGAGKDPAGIAAAAVYIATLLTNEKRSQKEIATAAGVTEVTVRNRYKELIEFLKLNLSLAEENKT